MTGHMQSKMGTYGGRGVFAQEWATTAGVQYLYTSLRLTIRGATMTNVNKSNAIVDENCHILKRELWGLTI